MYRVKGKWISQDSWLVFGLSTSRKVLYLKQCEFVYKLSRFCTSQEDMDASQAESESVVDMRAASVKQMSRLVGGRVVGRAKLFRSNRMRYLHYSGGTK